MCDPNETCTGSSGAACPGDVVTTAGTVCRTGGGDTCDVDEACTGLSGQACPADVVTPDATPCDDGLFCTINDACMTGACTGTARDCSDSDPCTTDTCDETANACTNNGECVAPICSDTPLEDCHQPSKSRFMMRHNPGKSSKDFLRFVWRKGDSVLESDFGSPQTTTTYGLCVYDQAAGVPTLATSLTVPPSVEHWLINTGRVLYRDAAGASDGVTRIGLRAGFELKTNAQMRAKGEKTPLPAAASTEEQFNADPAVIVQMITSDGACWSSAFGGTIKRNLPGAFKARTP